MVGQIHSIIQKIIAESGKNDPMTISYIRTKLILKGVDPDKWKPETEDSPEVLEVVENFYYSLIKRSRQITQKIFTAQSIKTNPKEAVAELKTKLDSDKIKAITFFASSIYDPAELIAAMNEAFPNIYVWGCSSYAEIITGKIIANSIVAMAFTDEIIEDIKIEIIDDENIDIKSVINSFEDYYYAPISELDNKKYLGLVYLTKGKTRKEEFILDELGNYSNLFFVGGSPSDDFTDFTYPKVMTYANGKYYKNTTIIALIKSKVKFGFEKMQSFLPTNHKVVATKVDEQTKTIYELDGQPAMQRLCELLNVSNTDLKNIYTGYYSLGFIIDNEPFLRAIEYREDSSIFRSGCTIKEGMELTIMEAADIVATTEQYLEKVKKKHKSISAALAFDCCFRFMELSRINQVDEYSKLYADFPVIGFYTYGEVYIGHLNQTLVMLVFEEE